MEGATAKNIATTLGWGVLALVIGQGVALGVLIWWAGGMAALASLHFDGAVLALSTLIANPLQIAILALAAHWRSPASAGYLGLNGFRARDFGVAVAAAIALGLAIYGFGWLTGQDLVTPFQIEAYATSRSVAWLVALFVAVVFAAPLGEEVLFRGFLYRGLIAAAAKESGLPDTSPDRMPVLVIGVISVLWTALHIQYDLFGLSQVFLLGLLLGWVRWRSGSTTLTFVLHALVNLESAIETVIKVGWVIH